MSRSPLATLFNVTTTVLETDVPLSVELRRDQLDRALHAKVDPAARHAASRLPPRRHWYAPLGTGTVMLVALQAVGPSLPYH